MEQIKKDSSIKEVTDKAAYLVKNQSKKVSLKDSAVEFLIEFVRHSFCFHSQGSEEGQTGNAGPDSRVTAKYDRISEDIARNIEAQEQLLLQIQV